jgi:hypothetical protein
MCGFFHFPDAIAPPVVFHTESFIFKLKKRTTYFRMKFGFFIFFIFMCLQAHTQLSTVSIDGRIVSTYFKKDAVAKEITEVMVDSSLDEVDIVTMQPVRFPKGRIREANVVFPLKLIRATSLFGFRYHPIRGGSKFHAGIDLRANYEGVYAFSSGVVERASYDANSGNCVVIDHGAHIKTVYAHLSYVGVVPRCTYSSFRKYRNEYRTTSSFFYNIQKRSGGPTKRF